MDCNINGVTCIKGEIHSIMTLMRLHTRWSQTKLNRDVSYEEDDALVQSFRRLNEYLEGLFDLREVDCVMYIMPFHNLIVSEKASGPLTSCALTSLSKFALYGFLSEQCPRVQEGILLISNCISRCVFEETDWESDELILMKLLELSALCYRCNASRLLTISSAWDIYSTCISIHNHYRASKILKSEAENALVHLTLSTFGRIVHSPGVRNQRSANMNHEIMCELESLKGRSWESIKDNYNLSSEVGIALLLVKIMSGLSDMADSQKQPVEMIKFSLVLINIALETGGPALGVVQPLVDILSNEVCRNLLRASQSDDLAIISLSLRVVYNLFMSIKNHMKVQLEVFLISVHLRLINSSSASAPSGATASATPTPLSAKEELALESLLEFCREPSLMNDIYVNYDCDVQCTNLFDTIIHTLCSRALPLSLHAGTSFGKPKAAKAAPPAPTVPGSAVRANAHAAIEAPSPTSQLLDFGSSGSIFGLDNPAPSSSQSASAYGTASTPVRLTIINRLALDGVLAVLRSVAGRYVSSAAAHAHPLNTEASRTRQSSGACSGGSNDVGVTGAFLSIEPHILRGGGSTVGPSDGAAEGAEQLVDKWCESGSTSPTADMLSQEDLDGPPHSSLHGTAAAAPSTSHDGKWSYSRHMLGSEPASSNGGSPFSSVHGERLAMQGLSAVDGENEETAAVLQARARQAEMLRQRKLMKHKYKLAAEKFNSKPLKSDWIRFAMDLGILESTPDADADAGTISSGLPPDGGVQAASGSNVLHNNDDHNCHGHNSSSRVLGQVVPVQADTSMPAVVSVVEPVTGIDAAALAKFFRRTPGLGKTQIGEYISKGPADIYPFHALVLKEYVKTFDFSGESSSFDAALRMFLGEFKLPGEAQCIDRIMEAFAGHLYEHLGPGRPFANADAAYILAFSTIMLNTDLHNPQIPQSKKMTKAEFVRNNRGINDGKDIPQDYLENLYSEIKNRQIQVDIDISDTTTALGLMDFADNTMWNKLLHKGTADQEPAVFTSTLDARRTSLPLSLSQQPLGAASAFEPLPSSARVLIHESNGAPVSCSRSQSGASSAATTTVCATAQRALYERDMFLVMARPVLETLVLLYDNATEDALVCRILRGIWDFIAICSDFGLQQMLNSVVHLLCFRSRALLESERRVPLKPHTRNNVLAHKARFKQLQAETGVDLHALVSLDFDALITYPTGPTSDRHHEQAKFMTTAEHAPLQLQASKPEVSWSYSWMIKGELLMRVAFHTAEKSPVALQQDAWSALLMLLSWVRARGALPPSLALVGDDFCLSEIHWQDPLPADCDTPDQCGTSKRPTTATAAVLSPSVYAHRCYLEAYGLALERSAGGRNSADTATGTSSLQQARDAHGGATGAGYSAGGGSAWFGLGFLFSDSQQHGRSHHSGGLLTAPSGTLDLPNLYRNTNASLCVSMTGEPLRPDDEILKLSLERSRPAELIYQQLSPGDAEITSTVLKAALAMLMTMVKQLTATPRAGPVPLSVAMPASQRTVSNSSSVHTSSSAVDAVVDLESSFPVQMLSNQFVSSDVKELDAVMLLEWITHIVVRNDDSISLFWGDLNDFVKFVLEERVELTATRCPYFLERCISVLTRAVLCVVTASNKSPQLIAVPTSKVAQPLTKSLLHSAALANSSQQAAWSTVWQSLRLLRGIPSDVIANVSDRLGVAVLELLMKCHAQPQLLTPERWFMVFSLLSAASSGSAGRPFVWDAVRFLLDNDLVDDGNFTACRHLVLRFIHGVFPGDSSEEHRNKSSGASSAHMQRTASDARSAGGDRRIGAFAQQEQDNAHMAESIGYLMRLCLMAVAGYRTKISHSEIPTGTALDRPQVVSRSPKVLKLNGVAGTSSASREIAAFQVAAVDSFGRGKGNVKIPSDLQGVGSPSISYLKSPAASNAAGKPTANAAFTGAGGSGDPQNLCVQCIYLPRGEEVELLWLETCKIYASLSHSPDTVVSTMATQSLLTILRAGMSGTFPDLIILKALGELVSRLQLGFSATVARTANVDTPGQDANSIAYNIAHAVSVSQRSCNVVFEVVVAQIKAARDLDEFHTIWVRFISLVASNAHAAVPKGQHWWHDEMCDMLEALLRLLRLPATASAPKTSPRLNAVEETAPTAKTTQQPTQQSANSGGGGYFGILGWIVAPLVAATDGPDVVRRATASAPVPSTTVESTGRSEFMSPGNNSNDAVIEPSDGYLLRISWQQICTAYPAFPASLQARDPKLLHRISTALLLPERYFQKNVYTERVNSAELVLPLEDATSRRKNVQRLPESSHQSVAVLPEDHTHPKEDTVLPSEMEIAEASSDVANPPEVINTSTLIADGPSTHTEERVTAPQKTPHDIRTHAQQTPPEMPPLVVSSVATSSPLEMDTITLTSVDRSGATLTSSCTPVRQAHQHAQLQEEMPGTPLADESMSMILPTPVQTPSGEQEGDHVSAAGLSPSMFGSARPMPFVRDLTPIFASAEVERRNASTSIQAAPSAGKTGDNVVRRLEVGSPAAGPWKTYPLQMPGTQGTPQAHQEPPQQPQQMCPSPAAPHRAPQSTAAHPQAGKAIPTRVAAKPLSSRVQIV